MMRSFKKLIATLLLFVSILVPAVSAHAESLNAIIKYSIYDLYSGEFIQDVNFLTHSSKDASIVQTVQWFTDRGIMMDPKRFNLKVNSNLTQYSTSIGTLSAYTADIMVYTTEADVLKSLDVKSETEPGVRYVIEMNQYEPEATMRRAWEQATNAVPAELNPEVPAEESSASSSSAVTSNAATSSRSTSQAANVSSNEASSSQSSATSSSRPQTSGSEINTPASVGQANASSNESGAPAANQNQNQTQNQNQKPANNNNAGQNQNQNQQPARANNQAANTASSSETKSEAAQAPVKEKASLPKTGESANIGWIVALVFVGGGVLVLLGYNRKTRK